MNNLDVGIQLPLNDRASPAYIAEAAALVERLGFDAIWVPEHVLFFAHYESRYPYADDGRIPGNPTSLIDPFMALTYLAAHTQRVRLGTGICIVPQRNPVYCAKQVADLDYLSGGRVDFGIGVGWLKEEFEALGVPWANRGGRTDECLDVMLALWQQDAASHHGERFRFDGAYQGPKPVQQPHPPLIFGGESAATVDRIARRGQGWYLFDVTPDELADHRLPMLREALQRHDRSLDDIALYVTPRRGSWGPDAAAAYAELGVQQLIGGVYAENLEKLEQHATALLERCGR